MKFIDINTCDEIYVQNYSDIKIKLRTFNSYTDICIKCHM